MVRGVFYESANLSELNQGIASGEERLLDIHEARLAKAALELQTRENNGTLNLSAAQEAYLNMRALQDFLSQQLSYPSLTRGLRCHFFTRSAADFAQHCLQSDLAKKLEKHTLQRAKGAGAPRKELLAKNKLSYIPSKTLVAKGIKKLFLRPDIAAFDGTPQKISLIDGAYAYLLCNATAGEPDSKIDHEDVTALLGQGRLFGKNPARFLKEFFLGSSQGS